MEEVYKLDEFLTVPFMKELVENNGMRIVNDPSNLGDILDYYQQHIQKAEKAPYIYDESRQFEIKIPVSETNYYKMKWSIPKARYIAEKNTIEPDKIPMSRINPSLNIPVRKGKADEKTSQEPILVVFYPPIPMKYIVIDGTEQARKKRKNGAKKIDALVLEPYVHWNAMANDLYRSLFAVHFNYSLMCSHLAGDLTLDELEKRMFAIY